MGGDEGLDIVEEFYSDESAKHEQHYQAQDMVDVKDIKKGLQQSVQALN